MTYIFSKFALVNLLKHGRNLTLLRDTVVTFGLPSKQLGLGIYSQKIKLSQNMFFVRILESRYTNPLVIKWHLLCQGSGLGMGLRLATTVINGTRPTDISVWKSRSCSLEQHQIKHNRKFIKFLSILWEVWDLCLTFFRAIRLGFTFIPLIVLFPLTLISNSLKNVWYKLLLFSLQFSGPIFVKLGQWASTRRDLFPEELCTRLEKLQRRNVPHSWFYTTKSFERAFGPNWRHFLKLDNNGQPVGSGCCAQVYKAWIDCGIVIAAAERASSFSDKDNAPEENSFGVEVLEMYGIGSLLSTFEARNPVDEKCKGNMVPVAVKVLHPRMTTLLRRDLSIMKATANFFTWLMPSLQWLSLPECVEDFSQLMKAQVNFCIEASNMETFAANFAKVKTVCFPRPISALSSPFLLVETYEEGRPMQEYITSKETKEINIRLADIGVNAILKMVFEDNFAHGDLHPGNMLVQELQPDTSERASRRWWKVGFVNEMYPLLRLVILDCGIVASLDAQGKRGLRDVFTAVANGDGRTVAELFLTHSKHQCQDPESFKEAMSEIVLAALGKTVTLAEIEVSSLMTKLFSTMIKHKVKMDGSFSSIILSIMVVEGLGRSLDPTIDIVEKAKPYLFSNTN